MNILRAGIVMPAPSKGTIDDQKKIADELNTITTDLNSTYGKGKIPLDPAKFDVPAVLKILNAARNKEEPRDPKAALTLEEASLLLAESRDPKILAAAWEGWHAISPVMKPDYQRMVEIGNEGARELGAYAQARRALPVPRALRHCRGLDARRRGLVHRVAQLLLARKGSGRQRQLRVLIVAPESKAVVGAQRAQHVCRRAAALTP